MSGRDNRRCSGRRKDLFRKILCRTLGNRLGRGSKKAQILKEKIHERREKRHVFLE
jgi:hypothetical protein